MMTKPIHGTRLAALILAFGMVVATGRAQADDLTAVPPNSPETQALYSQLQQDWWNWAASLLAAGHPLADETGEDCDLGQEGDVWFLGGTFAEPVSETKVVGVADRTCQVPEGKAVFFPIVNLLFTNIGEDPPFSDAELEAIIAFLNTAAEDLKLELDGVEVPAVKERFESESGAFTLVFVDDGIFGEEGGETRAADAGFYVLLEPLTSGVHEIDFEGSYVFTEEEHGFNFEIVQDIHYTLVVD